MSQDELERKEGLVESRRVVVQQQEERQRRLESQLRLDREALARQREEVERVSSSVHPTLLCWSTCLFVCLYVCLSVHVLHICLSVCLFVHLLHRPCPIVPENLPKIPFSNSPEFT